MRPSRCRLTPEYPNVWADFRIARCGVFARRCDAPATISIWVEGSIMLYRRGKRALVCAVVVALALAWIATKANAQQGHTDHSKHNADEHAMHMAREKGKKPKKASAKKKGHEGHTQGPAPSGHANHAGAAQGHEGHDAHRMKAFLGPYPMTREGSGTSWVPDTTPHEGIHGRFGDWSTMAHTQFNFVYDSQGGPRGADKAFVSGMVMAMAQRPLGDGTFGLRAMVSPDPFMGPSGYPLLLASGETADGRTPLIDRQHPHDLFMELAATYSRNISDTASLFLYAGLPGEPALGPPAFMHGSSGMDIPEAPITRHWLASTHLTISVVSAGMLVLAWGRKMLRPGEMLDGFMLESAVIVKKTYTLFLRAERLAETELHHDVPALHDRVLLVNKVSVGGIYDFYRTEHVRAGIGGLVSRYALPDELKPLYGSDPTSGMIFGRIKVQ